MKKVFAYIHTHWDREWYREFEEFRIRLVEVVDDVLKKLTNGELPSFYFDGQTGALEDYLEIKPQNKELIKNLIIEKKLFIGPYFCSTDSFLVDGESLIRNLQMGISYAEEFGCKDFIAYHADTFGHSKFIPEIAKYFKIKNAVFWRGLGELESDFLFRGLRSTYLIEGYFHDYFNANVSYEKKAEFLKRTLDRISAYSGENILLPLGADHLGAPSNLTEQINEVNKLLDDYEIILTTPFEYFKNVENNYKKYLDCEFRDTKRNFILPGVYSSRIDLKQENARLQWQTARLLQPLQAIMSRLGKSKNFQNEVNYIYKELIKNHAHDSIYGCSVDNVHKENRTRFLKVKEASNALLNSVKRDIHSDKGISFINLSNFVQKGAFRILTDKKLNKKYNAQLISKSKGFPFKKVYDINQIPITEDYTDLFEYLIDLKETKNYCSKNLSKNDIEENSTLFVDQNTIENSKIKLEIKNGEIEITDKTSGKSYKDFIKFTDRADIGDSYSFGALQNDSPIYSKAVKTKIIEKGHIRCILEITFEILIPAKSSAKGRTKSVKKHILKIQTILENQNDFLEFKISWENKSKNHILQVEFYLPEPITQTFSDDLTGYIKREFDPDYDIYKEIPAPRGVELKNNTAPLQKALWTQNLGIVTEGLTEYEIAKNKLSLTLLRATGTISNPKNPTRGTPAGPPLPTPDLQMVGENCARFALTFKNKIEEIEQTVEKLYETAVLAYSDMNFDSLFEWDNKNIFVSTIKTNPDNDLIIRFVNKSDSKQSLKFKTTLPHNGIFITDAMEKVVSEYEDTTVEANSFIAVLLRQ